MAMSAVYSTFCGQIVHQNIGGAHHDLIPDPLGSTVALVNSSGTISGTYEYTPYGEIETQSGTKTPFSFVGTLGYYRDAVNSALTYIRARWYKAAYGRWTTVDPLWPREDAFIYGHTEPTTLTDATGMSIPACTVPCAGAAVCAIDLIAACWDWTGFSSFQECAWQVYEHLPDWLKWACGAAIAGCIACLGRQAIKGIKNGGKGKPPPGPVKINPPKPKPAPKVQPKPSGGGPKNCPPRQNPGFPKGRWYQNCKAAHLACVASTNGSRWVGASWSPDCWSCLQKCREHGFGMKVWLTPACAFWNWDTFVGQK